MLYPPLLYPSPLSSSNYQLLLDQLPLLARVNGKKGPRFCQGSQGFSFKGVFILLFFFFFSFSLESLEGSEGALRLHFARRTWVKNEPKNVEIHMV